MNQGPEGTEDTKKKLKPCEPIDIKPEANGTVLEITDVFDSEFIPPAQPDKKSKIKSPGSPEVKDTQRTDFSSCTPQELRSVLENAARAGADELQRCILTAKRELQYLQSRLREENRPIAEREAKIEEINRILNRIRHDIRITVSRLLGSYNSAEAVNTILQEYHDFTKEWEALSSIIRLFRPDLVIKWLGFRRLQNLLQIEAIQQVIIRSVKETATSHNIMYNPQEDDIDYIFTNSSEGMRLRHDLDALEKTMEKLAGMSSNIVQKIKILEEFLNKYGT